jgi:methyl-accepting chemotaxis protein
VETVDECRSVVEEEHGCHHGNGRQRRRVTQAVESIASVSEENSAAVEEVAPAQSR